MGSCAAPSAKGDDKFITTDYLQQCHGGYRAVEHGVPGTRHPGVGRGRQAGGRRAAAIPVAAGLGAHQPNRRLRLAAEPQTGRREVSALTDARKTLAYDFFRILRAPQLHSFKKKTYSLPVLWTDRYAPPTVNGGPQPEPL